MKKVKIKIISVLCIIFFSTSYISVFAESADVIQSEIEANKEALEQIEKDKEKIKEAKEAQNSELDRLFGEIDAKGSELRKAEADVQEFQDKIDKLQEEIDLIQQDIDNTVDEIDQKKKLIEQKEKELEEVQDMLDERIRSYYKIDMTSQYIYMILSSKDFGQLISNIQAISRIINIDKELMANIKTVQKELAVERESLEKKLVQDKKNKEEIVIKQSDIVEAQKEFIVIKDEKQRQMDELLALENEKANVVASLTAEELALQEKMGDLVSYNEALKAELDNIFNSVSNSGGGNPDISNGEGFLRPVGGPITDPFGPRINPVTGEAGFHNGVDFGEPYGTPVAASKSGVVTYAGWIGGYGNSVIIDHGGGVTTLYGHNQSLNVSVGQQVSRGETVAFVGSTGQSTGPHVHFEIRFNNVPQNPMDYV